VLLLLVVVLLLVLLLVLATAVLLHCQSRLWAMTRRWWQLQQHQLPHA
jgi:hypothetical protein